MAQKDYVGRGRSAEARRRKNTKNTGKKKRTNGSGVSVLIIMFAIAIIVAFISSLWFITHHKKEKPLTTSNNQVPENGLPPKPEERWRYIKELENRQVIVPTPTEPNAGGELRSKTQLTNEQQQLLAQIQADMKQPPTLLNEVPWNNQQTLRQQNQLQMQSRLPPYRLPANTKMIPPKSAQHSQAELKSKEHEKKPQYWLIQCGSFKAVSQAESVRAGLTIEGFESRITTNGNWNRVVLGSFNDRSAVDNTLKRLRSSGHTNCIPVAGGVETH